MAVKRAKKLPLFTQAIGVVMVLFFILSFVSNINEAFMLYPSAIIPDWERKITNLSLTCSYTSSLSFDNISTNPSFLSAYFPQHHRIYPSCSEI